jgi:hypothetical protein
LSRRICYLLLLRRCPISLNNEMLLRRSIVLVILMVLSLLPARAWENADTLDIENARLLLVSSLDSSLPKVTLEFFLKYEGEGAPIHWSTSLCDSTTGEDLRERDKSSVNCVRAEVALKESRSVVVVLAMAKPRGHTYVAPNVIRVSVKNSNGWTNVLRGLSDLPAELHRPLPKSPRDLPLPEG